MKRAPSEHQEQRALIEWADFARHNGEPIGWDLAAIPNGGARHPAVAAKLKAEGVRAGMPDLMLMIAVGGYHGLFIELKAAGGSLRTSQRARLERLQLRGYRAVCCRGFEEARAEIEAYLALGRRVGINGAH